MRAKHLIKLVLALVAVALLLAGSLSIASAQRGTGYTIDWWTVDGGGQTQPDGAGGYTLDGTIGQPDADGWSGGGYTLSGGFWGGGGGGVEYTVYLPLILRSH
ncbi:MAG: hypothetical protein PVH59_02710 [Anaerolineae bacterium]|jgi:hypothetical protein